MFVLSVVVDTQTTLTNLTFSQQLVCCNLTVVCRVVCCDILIVCFAVIQLLRLVFLSDASLCLSTVGYGCKTIPYL